MFSVSFFFGWVSIFPKWHVIFDFFDHRRIDIKSDYKIYTFMRFMYMRAYKFPNFRIYMRAYRHETHKHIDFVVTFYVYTPIRSKKSKITFHWGKIDTHPKKKDTENTKEQKTTLCLYVFDLYAQRNHSLNNRRFERSKQNSNVRTGH